MIHPRRHAAVHRWPPSGAHAAGSIQCPLRALEFVVMVTRMILPTSLKLQLAPEILSVFALYMCTYALEDILVLETERSREGERRSGIGVCDAVVALSSTPDVDSFPSSQCLVQYSCF